ncbi:hypothetical protein SIID45300_01379 [Candidatus Magnetaquicoccaceae bacterium FCR-1]|uniref:MotA/TolQ/ExbB proton channel domain-containing protein n=1 Tax=Candidatus Magnetaquiglobus chichijimensis TaxID=3141448 RepID=A0ABQ0C839_9PROT
MRDGESRLISGLFSMVWAVLLAGGAMLVGLRVFRELDVVALAQWASLPSFLSIPLQRQGDGLIIATLAGVVAGFLFLFLFGYLLQAFVDALRLGWVARSVRARVASGDKNPAAWSWPYYGRFTRLWREFARSLTPESLPESTQAPARTVWVAHLPADLVFTQQSLVDVPMRVEFFRHLPGILTGAGIVSTFAGILMGLTGFDPSVGADQVSRELQGLFMGVSTAFTASFFAIITAILVTVVEKFLLHGRYAQVIALQGLLNRLFVPAIERGGDALATTSAWDGSVERIVAAIERLEPLLTREHGEREDAIMAVNLGLSSVMATMERIAENLSARESEYRLQQRAWMTDMTTLLRGVEEASRRQLGMLEQGIGREVATREWLDGRLDGIDGHLAPLAGQLSAMGEGLATLGADKNRDEAVQLTSAEALRTVLSRIEARLDEGLVRFGALGELHTRGNDGFERLGSGLDSLERGVGELARGVGSLGQGVSDLGRRLEMQSAQQIERSQEWAVGLDRLADGVEAQRGLAQRHFDLDREFQVAWRQNVAEIVSGLGGVRDSVERLGRPDGEAGLAERLDGFSATLEPLLIRLAEESGRQVAALSERLASLASQQASEAGRLLERLAGWERVVVEGQALLSALDGRLEAQGAEGAARWREILDAVARLRAGLDELTDRFPERGEVAGWLREAATEWTAGAEARQTRFEELVRAGQGEIATRIGQGVEAIEAVRAGQGEIATRIGQGVEAIEAVRAGQGEIATRIDGGLHLLEAMRDADAGLDRLLEGVGQRLEALRGGWREGIDDIVARVAQAASQSDGLLRELLLKVERASSSGEEGMALLFGEMGREMERMRRQIRESAGQLTSQTREWLTSNALGGEEKLQSLARGVSEEVKSALHTLADERSQQEGDRESVLVERLLSQTAEQAEGVKVAVLEELDETAKLLASHLRASGEALARSREEMAREVVDGIAARMESAFGGVAGELAEMRGRLEAERAAMEQSLQTWVAEASRSTVEESRELARRLMEVRSHFDERHQGVIGVIDSLGKGLERDLVQLRDGLYHKNEESTRHMESHLTELGQLLEGVVTSLGREQSVFIEMLGERLDTLRRRLRVK